MGHAFGDFGVITHGFRHSPLGKLRYGDLSAQTRSLRYQ